MNPLVALAKSAVENFVREGKIISPAENLPKEFLLKKSGVFVTIEKEGSLRGCIGTYLPTKENIAQEIICNAIAAATEDYRFGSIQENELPYLAFTVYTLGRPELIKDISGLNPKKYGIIVKTNPIQLLKRNDVVFNGSLPYKSGLLLPDLEGIKTAEQQVLIACQKGGIDLIRENIIIYRFTVNKYGEKD